MTSQAKKTLNGTVKDSIGAMQSEPNEGKEEKDYYPFGRLSTNVRSILSLEPPSDANPACISTAMASTTCLNLPTLVSHPSSSSLTTFATFFHFLLLFTLRPTTTAATAHVATATVTATPTTTLPISPDQPNYILPHSLPIAHHHHQTPPFQHARNQTLTNHRP